MKPTQRMIGIFRGGVQHPHHLGGANRFSPSSHAQPCLSLQSTEGSRCGRKLDRDRHPYRISRQVTIQNSFHLATLNTQGLEWSSLEQRHKLQHAILAARKYKWDLLLLSELRDRDNTNSMHMVYTEEFLFLQKGRVGCLMPFHIRRLWEDQGCQWLSPNPHLFCIFCTIQGRLYAFVSVYIPTGQTFEQRKLRQQVYVQARELYEDIRFKHPLCFQIWGGDWNGHVGRDHVDNPHRHYALKTPTTNTGVEQRRWLASTALQCVDTQFHVGHRGTWQHPQNHKFYELDYFCASDPLIKQTQTVRTLRLGSSDHAAKQMLFHLPLPKTSKTHQKRVAKTYRIREQSRMTSGLKPRLNYDAIRGPSSLAHTNRGIIHRNIQTALAAAIPDLQTHTSSSSRSDPDAPSAPSPMDIYTDGSCVVTSAARRRPAGWGLAVHYQGWAEYYGPVVYDKSHKHYLGASLGSNNTAELCAIGHAMNFLLRGTSYSGPVTIKFDSVYAYKMATGKWKPQSNIALVQRVHALVCQVCGHRQVFWQHVYGHTGVEGNERADKAAAKGAQGHSQFWPFLRLQKCPPRHISHPPLAVEEQALPQDIPFTWAQFADVLVQTVEQQVGRSKPKKLQSFYNDTQQEHIHTLISRQAAKWQELQNLRGHTSEPALRKQLAAIKQEIRDFKQSCRNHWVLDIIHQLEQAMATHDLKQFYTILPKLGVHTDSRSFAGQEPFTLPAAKTHFEATMNNPLPVSSGKLQSLASDHPTAHWLADPPSRPEVEEALQDMRDSAPGADEVTVGMLRLSGELGLQFLWRLMVRLWNNPSSDWEPLLHEAVGVPLWKKKGTREDLNQYRLIVLLSVASRLLAKIIANRLRLFAESHLPAYQWGFRPNRSCADVILVLRLIADMALEVQQAGKPTPDNLDPLKIILLDIQKAYPSVNRTAAWHIFRKHFGIPQHLIDIICTLHSCTTYRVRSRAGFSAPFHATKGFREGCPSSPVLFNLFHTVPMQDFVTQVSHKWSQPGIQLQCNTRTHIAKRARKSTCEEPENDPLQEVLNLLVTLFADDTSIITRQSRAGEIERVAVDTLRSWGQTVHPQKTERLLLTHSPPPDGCESHVRFLGSWFQHNGLMHIDTDKRLHAAKHMWRKVYSQLPRLGLPVTTQCRLVRATVVACLLYGCEVRTFDGKQFRQYQTFLNTITFGLLKQRRRTMSEDKLTMSDLRAKLGLDTVRTMIGYRTLCFLGHTARKPTANIERQMLFATLVPERNWPAQKRGHQLRHRYWQLLKQLGALSSEDPTSWHTTWFATAQAHEGRTWHDLVLQWLKQQRANDSQDSWALRHAPGGKRDKQLHAAQERARALHGILPGDNGKYKCPHCNVEMILRSMKLHVGPCSRLPPEQRAILAARRQARQSQHLSRAGNEETTAPVRPKAKCRPNRLLRRLKGKQPPPPEVAPAPRRPHRQLTAQELPAPRPPEGWPANKCQFCLETFPDKQKWNKHVRCCSSMPYSTWISRVKQICNPVTVTDHKCPHCHLPFWTAHAKGRHSVVCKRRRIQEGLALSSSA